MTYAELEVTLRWVGQLVWGPSHVGFVGLGGRLLILQNKLVPGH